MKKMATPRHLIFALVLLAAFAVQGLYATSYVNEGIYAGRGAPLGSTIIDVLSGNGAAVFVAAGKKYTTTPDGAYSALAGNNFYNDSSVFWVDCSRGITAQHRALGFIDFMVSVIAEEAPNVSVNGITATASDTNTWTMRGDSDKRDNQDIRAVVDGQVVEFLDTRYKCQFQFGKGYDDGNVSIAKSRRNFSGEFCILRMEVPKFPFRSYNFYIGPNVILPYINGSYYGSGYGKGLSYQAKIYTPVLSNKIIPVVDIKSPSADGVWGQRYDDNVNVLRPPVRVYYVPPRLPIIFTGENSYRSNVNITSWEWMAETAGLWTAGGPTYAAVFQTNGNYQVKLRIKSDAGDIAVNDGSSNETGTLNRPDYNPAGLPFNVVVTDPPALAAMKEARPNPFILGQHSRMMFDFTLREDMPVSVAVYSLDGQLVRNLITSQGKYPAGFWTAFWDGKDDRGNFVAEGVYYGVMSTPGGKYLSKIHILRVQ